MKQIKTLLDAHNMAVQIDSHAYDALVPALAVRMYDDGLVGVDPLLTNQQFAPSAPTRFAFGHLLSFFKGPKDEPIAPYIGRAADHLYYDLPGDIRADVVNYWLNQVGRKPLLLRGYNRGGSPEIRAVASEHYGVVDNHHITEILRGAFNGAEGQIELQHCDISDEFMHLRIAVPQIAKEFEFGGYKQVYCAGVYVSNGTIKNRSVVVAPFIQGIRCMNSTVFGTHKFTRNHNRLSLPAARNHITEYVGTALNHSPELMQSMFDAALREIPAPSDIIDGILKGMGLADNSAVTSRVYEGMYNQGGANHFGLSNGLSFAAQVIEDGNERALMEMVAAEVIMADPSDLFGRIANLQREMADAD